MRRRGFTLIEVMVALVVASLLTMIAHRVFGATLDAGRTLTAARQSLDRGENAHRFLAATFLSLEVGAAGQRFEGRADAVRFAAWMETPDGWFEPIAVTIEVERNRLLAHVGMRPPIVLADSVVDVRFDYLLEPGADKAWITEWVSPLSAPIAVRLRVYRRIAGGKTVGDTTLLQIKTRK